MLQPHWPNVLCLESLRALARSPSPSDKSSLARASLGSAHPSGPNTASWTPSPQRCLPCLLLSSPGSLPTLLGVKTTQQRPGLMQQAKVTPRWPLSDLPGECPLATGDSVGAGRQGLGAQSTFAFVGPFLLKKKKIFWLPWSKDEHNPGWIHYYIFITILFFFFLVFKQK